MLITPATPSISRRTGGSTTIRLATVLRALLKIARDSGVTLLIENEHDCYMSTGTETAAFLEKLAPEGLRAVWDPGNAFCGSDEAPYPTGYEAIRPYVAHVHLKDPIRKADGGVGFVAMGDGEVDWVGQFRALKADGYNGVVSLETHYVPEGGTAEEGTRATFKGLKSVIEKAGESA